MKYFKLSVNDSEELWRKYKNFGIDFRIGNNRIYPEDLRSVDQFQETLTIDTLIPGENPAFSMVGTSGIIIHQATIKETKLQLMGLTLVPVIESTSFEVYFNMRFDYAIDCVNLEKSAFEAWPDTTILQPWNNPIARFFFRPTLIADKIPPTLEVFH